MGSRQSFTCETYNTVFDSREQLREHSIDKHASKKGTSTQDELTFSCEPAMQHLLAEKILDNIALNNMKVHNNEN